VDAFGKALLRGMGWSEGAPIGVTNPKVVLPMEFVSRPGYRTGLGASLETHAPPSRKKRKLKPGEKEEDFEVKVLPPNADGTIRHVKGLDEKLVPLSKIGLRQGALVGIVSGPHDGLYARVVKLFDGSDDVIVRLETSSEEVVVSKSDLSAHMMNQSSLAKNHPALEFLEKDEKRMQEQEQKDQSRETETHKSKHKSRDDTEKDREKGREKKIYWLHPHLVVRIISKSFLKGKYYLKKGVIVDVITAGKCSVQLYENSQLVEVEQKMLETVIPKSGEKVMIVQGKHAGKVGKMMSKDKDDAVIQLAADLSVATYPLDDISQYTGDYQ